MAMNVLGVILIDRFRRRTLILVSMIGLSIFLVILAIGILNLVSRSYIASVPMEWSDSYVVVIRCCNNCFFFSNLIQNTAAWIPPVCIASLILYVIFFDIGLGPLAFFLPSGIQLLYYYLCNYWPWIIDKIVYGKLNNKFKGKQTLIWFNNNLINKSIKLLLGQFFQTKTEDFDSKNQTFYKNNSFWPINCWNCSETALNLLWIWSETALKLLWNCSEIAIVSGSSSSNRLIFLELIEAGPRPVVITAGSTLNWIMNFVVAICFPTLEAVVGPYTFLIFFSITVVFTVFLFYKLPETKPNKNSQIEKHLRENLWKQMCHSPLLCSITFN